MPNSPTPVTEAIPVVLEAWLTQLGWKPGGWSSAAGMDPKTVWRILRRQGRPRFDQMETLMDVTGQPLSKFVQDCESAAEGRVVPVPLLEQTCRPSRSWTEAVGRAAAALDVDGFAWGLLLYHGRPVAMVPAGNGQVRLVAVVMDEAGQALVEQFGTLVRGSGV
jgi:hypothetical protein